MSSVGPLSRFIATATSTHLQHPLNSMSKNTIFVTVTLENKISIRRVWMTSLSSSSHIQESPNANLLSESNSEPKPADGGLNSHLLPDYSSLLQRCIDSSSSNQGIALHNHLSATGYSLSRDLHLSTKFIIFYSKLGHLLSARKVFDEMPQRSIVSWTAMISGYSQNGYPEEALRLFVSMRRLSSLTTANQFTYGSTVRACTVMSLIRVGEQVQGCIEKSRFANNLFVQSALLDLHSKYGSIEDACRLYQRMEKKDVVSWNSLIGGYAVRGLGHDSFESFISMLRDGLLPDHFTFANVLKACGSAKYPFGATQIHAFISKLGFGNHYVVTGSLIDAYGKCREMHSARLVYGSMFRHDLISRTALINGYASSKTSTKQALDLFCELNRMDMQVDDVILCSILNICANIGLLSLGRQIHAHTLKNRPHHDTALDNSLIDMYAKSGELRDAHCAFNEMRHKNVISWTSLINAYGKHGNGEGAITLFIKMEDGGVKPNDVTFLSVLFACSHSGLTAKGIDFFNMMISKYRIRPRAEHYSCVVDLLARGGLVGEAYDLVCHMDVKPNNSIWGSLLGACKIHGNTSLGEIVAGNLFGLDPERSVNYVVLANMYAVSGLWENAWKTRKLIQERSIKKIPGLSSI